MTAPPCALCSMKWLQAVASEPLWLMPSSTANATIGTSASRLARRASFRLNEASPTGSCTECVRKCAPLFPLSAIGNAFTPKLSSARSNANSRPKHRAVLSPRNANKLSCSVWPTTFTNSGHSIFHLRPASKLFNNATAGGSDWNGTTLVDTSDSFQYDPVADSITTIPNKPRATAETRALKFAGPIAPCSPAIWVMGGGTTPPNPSNEVDSFCPGGPPPTWRMGPPFVTPRRNFPTDTDVGDPSFGTAHIWLAGGYASDGVTPLKSMEIYCHVVLTPSESPPTPTPKTANSAASPHTSTAPVISVDEKETHCSIRFLQ